MSGPDIYVRFSECGKHIRKWSFEPFEDGTRYAVSDVPLRGPYRVHCPHCGWLGTKEEHDPQCPRYPNALRKTDEIEALRARVAEEAALSARYLSTILAAEASLAIAENVIRPFAVHVGKSGSPVVLKIGDDTWTGTLKTEHFEAASRFIRERRDC